MRGHLWTVIALAGCGCVSSAEPRGTMSAEGVGCSALISVLSMSTSDALLAMLGGGKPEFVTKAGFYFPEGI